MGIALCKKHGETGIVPCISMDICKEIMGNAHPVIEKVRAVSIKIFDGNDFIFEQVNYISDSIFKEHALKMKYEIHTESDEILLNELFPKTSGVCGKCFNEYVSLRELVF